MSPRRLIGAGGGAATDSEGGAGGGAVFMSRSPMIASGVQVTRAFPGLTFSLPMFLLQAPGTPDRVYVMERAGIIKSFPNRETARRQTCGR